MAVNRKTGTIHPPLTSRLRLCESCVKSGKCAGIRHCTRRISGEKLPAYDPAK